METDAKEVSDSSSEDTVVNSEVDSTPTEQAESSMVDAAMEATGWDDKEPEDPEEVEEEGQEETEDTSTVEGDPDEEPEEGAPDEETEEEGTEEPEAEEESEEDEKENTRFDQHPRFKQLIKEKNEFKARNEELESKAQQADGIVRFLDTNQLSNEEFSQGLDIMAAMKQDPEKALSALEPYVDKLRALTGSAVISEDLHQKIDEGLMDEPTGREMERLRAREKMAAQEKEAQALRMQQMQQQDLVNQVRSEASNWHANKAATDPDYESKRPLIDNIIKMNQTVVTSPNDAVTAYEQAYELVNQTMQVARPVGSPSKPTPSTAKPKRKARVERQENESVADVVRRRMEQS